ncbi:MAG: rhamnogalacturonan acetylesterase [Kiritimatiellia bacterium]
MMMKKISFVVAAAFSCTFPLFADLYMAGDSTMSNSAVHPQGMGDGCHTRDTGATGGKAENFGTSGLETDFPLGWRKPLEIGNYDVTIRLGDRDKPTVNFVKFMGRRLAGDRIALKAGEFRDFTFTARVPGPYTKKDDGGNRELSFAVFTNGREAPVGEPKVVRNDAAHTIWVCGDSTVTDQQKEPWGSWGQILPAFVKPGWACVNFARSGLAMVTFEGEGRLDCILSGMKPEDWVIVQFGHNDQKRPGEEPENGYTRRYGEWLAKFRAKGARLVVVSPCERRRFDEKTGEHQGKTLAGYADAARAFAKKNSLPFIDLNDITYRMQGALGADGSKPLQVDNKGKLDNTHHSIYGAYVNARIVASHLATFDGIGAAIRDVRRNRRGHSRRGEELRSDAPVRSEDSRIGQDGLA